MGAEHNTNFDEMVDAAGIVRPAYRAYRAWYDAQDPAWLRSQNGRAENFFRRTGITFNVYGQADGEERLIPFDMVPRIISGSEWRRIARGIEQRVKALNAFLHDIYHKQEIVRAGRLPLQMIARNDAFLQQMVGFSPPGGVYTHIVGIDLV
ncbi:MAG TPA: circularly permuted type 2 ATP-grasp protein, partial [Erythrobacter sp.]|nr:circularly permuted type 2 ATP-grasp protein [Erythrobacter sp.]